MRLGWSVARWPEKGGRHDIDQGDSESRRGDADWSLRAAGAGRIRRTSHAAGDRRRREGRRRDRPNRPDFLRVYFPRARSGLTESRGIPKGARVRFNLLAFDWRPAGMARAYSLDLRERVVGAVAAGQPCRSVAKTFMVSVASVVKWSQRQRAVGSPAALKMGGRRPYLV